MAYGIQRIDLNPQHRGGRWLCLVFTAILVPLLYSVALLVVDLHVHPDQRLSWQWNVGLRTVRCFLYNVLTTGLLIGFSPRSGESYSSVLILKIHASIQCHFKKGPKKGPKRIFEMDICLNI